MCDDDAQYTHTRRTTHPTYPTHHARPHASSAAGTANPLARRLSAKRVDPVKSKGGGGDDGVPFFQADSGGMRAASSSDIYFVGVIDILIQYRSKKKMEHKWKSVRAELQHRSLMHAARTYIYVPRTNSVLI